MQKQFLEQWVQQGEVGSSSQPRVFVVSCDDAHSYHLAVEVEQKLEPVVINDDPLYFTSIDQVKDELLRLGVTSAYLRLHTADDSAEATKQYHDIELAIVVH